MPKKTKSPVWTDDKVSELRTLAAKRLSATQIGKAMGKTRNSVIGSARRNNIEIKGNSHRKPSLPKVQRPAFSVSAATAIWSLKTNQCRWPMEDPSDPSFRFCPWDQMYGKSYCKHHYDLSVIPNTKGKRPWPNAPTLVSSVTVAPVMETAGVSRPTASTTSANALTLPPTIRGTVKSLERTTPVITAPATSPKPKSAKRRKEKV